LKKAASENGLSFSADQLSFEPWFYYEPGEIYAEHGQQFDYYNSWCYQLNPVVQVDGEEIIALPMGNLSNRYLMTGMGYFNPHSSDYILNLFRYMAHWFRYYAFSKRSLVFKWLMGSLLVMWRLLKNKKLMRLSEEGHIEAMQSLSDRSGISMVQLEKLGSLHRTPITNRVYRIMREFWIDRLAIALLMIGGTITLALVPIPLWIKLMVPLSSFPLLIFLYEYAARGESIFTVSEQLPEYARKVADTLPVKLVCFGHTHIPRLIPLDKGLVFVDTGAWAPVTDSRKPGQLAPGYRNYLLVMFDENGLKTEFGSRLEKQP